MTSNEITQEASTIIRKENNNKEYERSWCTLVLTILYAKKLNDTASSREKKLWNLWNYNDLFMNVLPIMFSKTCFLPLKSFF